MAHFVGTETPLGAATTWTSDTAMRNTFDTVKGTVFSDTAGVLHIQQGFRDATGTIRWEVDSTYTVTAGDGSGFSEELVAPLWRIQFVQAGTNAVLRIYAAANAAGYIGG